METVVVLQLPPVNRTGLSRDEQKSTRNMINASDKTIWYAGDKTMLLMFYVSALQSAGFT